MQRSVSPVVAVIVIIVLLAVVAFLWMRASNEEPRIAGPPPRRGGARQGPTETRTQEASETSRHQGDRRGSQPGSSSTQPGAEQPSGGE